MNLFLFDMDSNPLPDYSFLSGGLSDALSFARASSGSRTNKSGFLESVGVNVPRFDCDPVSGKILGILYEGQKTNVAGYGTDPANAAISRFVGTLTAAGGVAPDGAGTMARFSGALQARVPCGGGFTGGAQITISLYAKLVSGSVSTFSVDFRDGGSVNLASQLVLGQTVRLAGQGTVGAQGWWLDLNVSTGATIDIWGYQVETGGSASSFVANAAGGSVTRATDQLSFNVPAGVSALRYVFDDNSVQDVAVVAGAYVVPTNLNRQRIKRIYGL